ncbi:hypothetical protein P3W45_001416 [Vairimorpha bombi]
MAYTNILDFKDLYYDVKNKDESKFQEYVSIIRGMSGKIESGRLTGVMGNSGCDSKTYGEIRYNRELRTPKDWTSRIGYLPQDDCYYQELTVYDNIIYYLGFNNKYSKKNLHKEAIDILKKSQIVDKKDALMSSLSGGERKRAMIALTLSSEPEVLILDEPTSGLDSGSALNIIHNLKEYALKYNRMVILTIHNPGMGIFNMIDDLFFMTPDGLFYSGPVSELSLFFDKYKLVIKANISVPEFLSAVQHNESPFREEVFKIVSENINLRSKEVSICNNLKLDLTDLDFSHIFRILLFNMKLSWSRSTIIGILMKIYSVVYLGFAYKLTNETLSIIDSTDNFSRTFLKNINLETVKVSKQIIKDKFNKDQALKIQIDRKYIVHDIFIKKILSSTIKDEYRSSIHTIRISH